MFINCNGRRSSLLSALEPEKVSVESVKRCFVGANLQLLITFYLISLLPSCQLTLFHGVYVFSFYNLEIGTQMALRYWRRQTGIKLGGQYVSLFRCSRDSS